MLYHTMAPTTRKGGVRWRQVLKYQTHGAWVLLIAAAVVIGVAHYFAEPKYNRPVKLNDAAIGLPMEPETVPMAWAVVFPTLALLITVLATELGIMHNKQSLTHAIQAFLHTLWMAIIGFAVVLAVTEATKPVASRYRPDFLQRCLGTYDPEVPVSGGDIILPEECKGLSAEVLADGKKSFPSGHSSNTLSICWYCVIYLVHALYFRQGFYYMGGLDYKAYSSSSKPWQKVVMELLQGLLLLWMCVVLCIAWWIGVSRYTDHRHNIDDILGGFVAALLWMTPIAVISMVQLTHYHRRMTAEDNGLADEVDLRLPVAHPPSKDAAAMTTAVATTGSTKATARAGTDGPLPVIGSLGQSPAMQVATPPAAEASAAYAQTFRSVSSGAAVTDGISANPGTSVNAKQHHPQGWLAAENAASPQATAGAPQQQQGALNEQAGLQQPHRLSGEMHHNAQSKLYMLQQQQQELAG